MLSGTLSRIHEDDRSTHHGSPDRHGTQSGASTSNSNLTSTQLQRHNRTHAPAASSTGAGRLGYGHSQGGIAERDRDAVSSTRGSPDRKPGAGRGLGSSGRSDAGYSTNSTKSVAESVISRAAYKKGKF